MSEHSYRDWEPSLNNPPGSVAPWVAAALDDITRRLTALEKKQAKPTIWPHPEFWTVPLVALVGIVTIICMTVFR